MQHVKAEQMGIVTGNITTAGGSAGAVIFGFTMNDWGMAIGIVCALVGLVLSNYWQHKRSLREEAIRQATIEALKAGAGINIVTDDYGNATNATIQ